MTREAARILLVDDEPLVTQVLVRILRRRYTVMAVNSGQGAVDMIRHELPFDLVLCDVIMWPVTGIDVYHEATRLHPEMEPRFLLMTGSGHLPHVQRFLAQWPYFVLHKPFGGGEVEQLVEASLSRAAR